MLMENRLSQHQPRQRKSMSQVFLKETWPCERLAADISALADCAIEIGPGAGVLTRELIKAGLRVTAVEADPRFVDYLRASEKVLGGDGFEVVHADFLKFDLEAWLSGVTSRAAVVGNIPYHISAPIVLKVLDHLDQLSSASFLTQKEFAERIVAKPGSKSYGSLSVFVQLRAEATFGFKVEKTCFKPVPKVDSAVFTLVPRADRLRDVELLRATEVVCRSGFAQRRKKLRSSLKAHIPREAEGQAPVDMNLRPEDLSVDQFVELGRFVLQLRSRGAIG